MNSSKRLLDLCFEAQKFFASELKNSNNTLQVAKFLVEKNIDKKTVEYFHLGYADEKNNSLINYMSSKGFDINELLSSGLVVKNSEGIYTDRFINRLIYPIFSTSGEVVSFSGRSLDEDSPVYMNLSANENFSRENYLYGFGFASKEKSIILCEGLYDVIMIHQCGCKAVSTLGGKLTKEQAKIIKDMAEEVIICFDSDQYGKKMSSDAVEILNDEGLKSRIIKLSPCRDAAEYIIKYGASRFKQMLEK